MTFDLTPTAGEAAFGDATLVGDFAAELPKMLDSEQRPPWCSYSVRIDGRLVGMGGFKGDPDADGWVEIGYLTFVPEQRRGIATATAARLIEIAAAAGTTRVRAHTLPEHNPSTRALVANGFVMAGQVEDPEDGTVWRWERT